MFNFKVLPKVDNSHMIPGRRYGYIGKIPVQTRSYGTRFDIMNFQACEGTKKSHISQKNGLAAQNHIAPPRARHPLAPPS